MPVGAWLMVPVPIGKLRHLAESDRARRQPEVIIWVDATPPPVIHTPGRSPNQWLDCGEVLPLPITCPVCGWWRDGACQCDV